MQRNENELFFQLALVLTPQIGPIIGKTLLSYCGSIDQIFTESKKSLLKIPGVGHQIARDLVEKKAFLRAEQEIQFIEKNGIAPLFFLDKDYPSRLRQIPDAPILLFLRGAATLNTDRVLSIVGTRKPRPHSIHLVKQLLEEIPSSNLLVVSGLAYGVDIYAHRTCVELDIPTLGVLAHGLDRIYPPDHRRIAQQMEMQGGLLSEFPSQTRPDRERFPMRNRIIAGLSDAMVVVESKKRGGSMISAYLASDYHREVFTFPARPSDQYAAGNNLLIKTHRAQLIESATDLMEQLNWDKANLSQPQLSLFTELSEMEKRICEPLKEKDRLHLDQLTHISQIPLAKVAGILLELEFKGIIRSLPGNQYALY
ncbi:MAG: DNA-processing protein DprA [Bacteroidota bacterium]